MGELDDDELMLLLRIWPQLPATTTRGSPAVKLFRRAVAENASVRMRIALLEALPEIREAEMLELRNYLRGATSAHSATMRISSFLRRRVINGKKTA